MDNSKCGNCSKKIAVKIRVIKCDHCLKFFHAKCCNVKQKEFKEIKDLGADWNCNNCALILENDFKKPSIKCGKCKKTVSKNNLIINCKCCKKNYHSKCAEISFKQFDSLSCWTCLKCIDDI